MKRIVYPPEQKPDLIQWLIGLACVGAVIGIILYSLFK